MQQLRRGDLMGLEDYAVERARFRRRVMAHKQNRRIALGPNVTLLMASVRPLPWCTHWPGTWTSRRLESGFRVPH